MKSYSGKPRKYVQAKLDGYNLRVERTPDGVTFHTRTTQRDLPMLDLSRLPVGTVLYGELWYPGKPASEVSRAMAKRDTALRFSAFYTSALPAEAGLEYLQDWLDFHGVPGIDWWKPDGNDWERCKHFAEGLVYKDGQDLNLEKWKPTLTADLIVHDVTEGEGKYLGYIGALVCGLADGTIVANVSGMGDADRVRFSDHPPIGRVVEVEYQYVGAGGRLRHPRFKRLRDDKPAAECVEI